MDASHVKFLEERFKLHGKEVHFLAGLFVKGSVEDVGNDGGPPLWNPLARVRLYGNLTDEESSR